MIYEFANSVVNRIDPSGLAFGFAGSTYSTDAVVMPRPRRTTPSQSSNVALNSLRQAYQRSASQQATPEAQAVVVSRYTAQATERAASDLTQHVVQQANTKTSQDLHRTYNSTHGSQSKSNAKSHRQDQQVCSCDAYINLPELYRICRANCSQPISILPTSVHPIENSTVYPIGTGLPLPRITNPYRYGLGVCLTDRTEDRAACAIQTYQDLSALFPSVFGREMRWEDFIAVVYMSEASILYIQPGTVDRVNEDIDLQCYYGVEVVEGVERPRLDASCASTRRLFEDTVIRQLYEVCGQDGCTEDEFIRFMSGVPDYREFGIQGLYQASEAYYLHNEEGVRYENPFGGIRIDQNHEILEANGVSWRDLVDNAENALNRVNSGCSGLACDWGNPPSGSDISEYHYYFSHLPQGSETYGLINGRVYFRIGR